MSNYIEKVAIAGGQMGSYIVEALLKTGKHRVTAITRIDSTCNLPTGVDIKKANYDDSASLVAALQGQDANKPLYILSFLLSQKEMFDWVLRVTGTKEEGWKIGYEAAEARYAAGMARGDRNGFAKALYARVFYPDGCGNYEDRHGLHNDILGLPKEDLDAFTRTAVERAEGPIGIE
ncbi:hypothetical protein C8J56DRAFT_1038001 [Mycena floridula]|nr:hypothetical protein C8J56DRAFT_1038001 [Mycena floridula]